MHVVEQVAGPGLSFQPFRGTTWPVARERDALDVSLHDTALAEEVELTARLIVAANDVERPLARHEVDDILDVTRSSPGSTP